PPVRAGSPARIPPPGRLQPGRLGLARRAAVHHDRARLPHAHVLVPRREEAPEIRFRRGGSGCSTRAEPAAEAAGADATHVVLPVSPIRGYGFAAYGP